MDGVGVELLLRRHLEVRPVHGLVGGVQSRRAVAREASWASAGEARPIGGPILLLVVETAVVLRGRWVEGTLVGRRRVLLRRRLVLLLLTLLPLTPWAPSTLLAPASVGVVPRSLGLLTLRAVGAGV